LLICAFEKQSELLTEAYAAHKGDRQRQDDVTVAGFGLLTVIARSGFQSLPAPAFFSRSQAPAWERGKQDRIFFYISDDFTCILPVNNYIPPRDG